MNEVDPLSHTLGRIEQALDTITTTLREDRLASAQYRTDMRRDLTTVRDMVHDLRNRVNNNADEIADMRPDVEELRAEHQQKIGAWHLATTSARVAWTLFGGAIAALGASVYAWIIRGGK